MQNVQLNKRARRKSRPPLLLVIPALMVAVGACLPILYLLLRALEVPPAEIVAILSRPKNYTLLFNTILLMISVLIIGTIIALPLAWLVTRSDIKHKSLVTFLAVLPLAVPGYVMAYSILGLSGYYGFMKIWFDVSLPPIRGLTGASLALSLYTFPYIFLGLRSGFIGIDPALEETARSLGRSRFDVFRHVTIPQLWPALTASWLIVGLYTVGDFGAVGLMRYDVFSYAIYTQYSGAFDRSYAAWLSLMLLTLTAALMLLQFHMSKNRRIARTGTGTARKAKPVALKQWRWIAYLWIAIIALCSLGLPLVVLGHWMRLGFAEMDWAYFSQTIISTALIATPAAIIAVLVALPLTVISLRYPGKSSSLMDRLAYLGYATPSLALALAIVFFALRFTPWLYQTHALLIFAYVISFVAIAIGPIRLGLLQIGIKQEEVARSLGASPKSAFIRVVLPRLRHAMLAGGLLVFIVVVKELPLTYMLAPIGFRTLSMNVFSRTIEGMMAEAAPFALCIMVFSSFFVGLMLKYEKGGTANMPTQEKY
ncbi:ABC transporter permease [Brucellaceae bacterium C25G]